MKVTAEFHHSQGFETFIKSLADPKIRRAAAQGLNEHAEEQRRGSITRIAAYTGVPGGRVSGKTKVIKAGASAAMEAKIHTADVAIPLAEYGNPVWVRDLNPMADGIWGGPVSSMKGAEATGWNVRRQFAHAFIANGQVVVRKGGDRSDLKVLSMAVLANELAKPTRPNVPAAERYAAMDLEKRVMRHVVRALGA
jgi:hypothetical protein